VLIAVSKTDQEGNGTTIAIARGATACPVEAVRDWLDAADIESGPIFRPINKAGTVLNSRLTDRSVANIVKAYAGSAGLDKKAICRPLASLWLYHFGGSCRQVHFQDDGSESSQVG
jgi:hypothetical protein